VDGDRVSVTGGYTAVLETEISVELLIPSYNRLDSLRHALKCIRQLYPDVSICIGLQGEMPSDEFQIQLQNDTKLRVEKLSIPSTTDALNHCISSAKADVVLILDDDANPCFGWLESHKKAFAENADLAYTCGREVRLTIGRFAFSDWFLILVEACFGLFMGRNKKLNGRIVGWINILGVNFGNFNQPGTCIINSPRACNMAVRREIFLKIGGFNENFRGNAWGFEAEFGLRMEKEGRFGRYIGDAVVLHQEVPRGGSRQETNSRWMRDFFYNNKLLVKTLGPQAWLGALPRLAKVSIRSLLKS
jgi:GT2 family glycosyltransferase